MRGSRRPAPQDSTPSSAGERLRDALARKREGDVQRAQDDEARKQDAFRQSLSTWFNTVAAGLPGKVNDIAASLEAGRGATTHLSYAAQESIEVRGVGDVDLAALPGFQALDKTCRDLDVECSVTSGRHGYGRKSTAGQEYLDINIETANPYRPVTVETPKPYGSRRYR